jgi:hypothetical protein
MPLNPEVPFLLALLGSAFGIAAIPLDWVKFSINTQSYGMGGKTLNPPSSSLVASGFKDLYGATPVVALLAISALIQLVATGVALYASQKPNLRRMKDVAEGEIVAVLCLLVAGGIWGSQVSSNLIYVSNTRELLRWSWGSGVNPEGLYITLFSTGQLAGLGSLLFSVATGFTAYIVHSTAGTAAPIQVQALSVSAMGPQAPQQRNKSPQAGAGPAMEL